MRHKTESLGKSEKKLNNGNLHPVLLDYAKYTFPGLGFFKKILLRNFHCVFLLFNFVVLYV